MPDLVFAGKLPFASIDEQRDVAELIAAVLDPGPGSFILERLSGGRSGAHVFRVERSGGSRCPPLVVKIAPRGEGAREKANYDRFVTPLLPAAYRPDLLGFAEAGNRAALCYSFVARGDRAKTLTEHLAAGDLAAMELVLATIGEQLHRSWYSPPMMRAERDLAGYYLDRYFGSRPAMIETERTLAGHASAYFDAQCHGDGYRIGDTVFPSVGGTLFRGGAGRGYRSCILHGDLNSDNVIIDRGSARLIDFERTGRGHVHQDLVSLEASIRINHPSTASYGELWEIERSIVLEDPRIRTNAYAMAIAGIRAIARRYFGHAEERSNYGFAVATVGLRLMQATDLSDTARARISASALWEARALLDI